MSKALNYVHTASNEAFDKLMVQMVLKKICSEI